MSKDVEQQIEQAIMARTIAAGDRLPSENELAEQFGVSRTAVREALRMLNARGLVETQKGKGVFVTNVTSAIVTDSLHTYLQSAMDSTNALELIRARQIIEPPIAASAALYRTDADMVALSENYRQLQECVGDRALQTKLDMGFHLAIATATGSQILPLILEPIHRLFPPIKLSIYDTVPGAWESAVEWHGHILDAIAAGDPARARAAMTSHLAVAEGHIQQMLAVQQAQKTTLSPSAVGSTA